MPLGRGIGGVGHVVNSRKVVGEEWARGLAREGLNGSEEIRI